MRYPELNQMLDSIEMELRKLSFLEESAGYVTQVRSAFGSKEMTFEAWLANVFLPNARSIALNGPLPEKNQVATAALRNFDGDDSTTNLIGLLGEFDQAVEKAYRKEKATASIAASNGIISRLVNTISRKIRQSRRR